MKKVFEMTKPDKTPCEYDLIQCEEDKYAEHGKNPQVSSYDGYSGKLILAKQMNTACSRRSSTYV